MNVAFIPVRGGSKGIPLKNIAKVNGIPLLCYSLYHLEMSPFIDEIVVFSDNKEIMEVAGEFNALRSRLVWRSPKNAQDDSITEDAMLEYFTKYPEYADSDNIFLIQVTNPFLTFIDISDAVQTMEGGFYDSVLTATRQRYFRWHHRGTPLNYHPSDRPRRQEWIGEVYENGALYGTKLKNLLYWKTRVSGNVYLSLMPSYTIHEIDTPMDMVIVEAILKERMEDICAKIRKRCGKLLENTD